MVEVEYAKAIFEIAQENKKEDLYRSFFRTLSYSLDDEEFFKQMSYITSIWFNRIIDNIKYKALKCYREDNCGTTITLQELYDLKYSTTLVNPLTKEIYDSNTTLTIKGDEVIFNGQLFS